MALQKQMMNIPISQGLDTKTDSKQVPIGKALTLENARFQKTEKLSKRYGFSVLTNASDTSGLASATVNNVIADDSSINLITSNGIYGYASDLLVPEFKYLSQAIPFPKVRSEYVAKSTNNHFNPDMKYSNTYGIIVTVYREVQELSALTLNFDKFLN